ncbi:MAG: Transposase DDE domain-containing protein [Candidatus Kentron sp. G]|nr:MAG: Transposase DDE domain-containing protein [Candidatus Kentron sp. G]
MLMLKIKQGISPVIDLNSSHGFSYAPIFSQETLVDEHGQNHYQNDGFGIELQQTVYALDSTTIDLCLSVFPWAKFRKTKSSALTIAQLYRCRWQVELFFKWIKQHLRIKSFFGTSENAVKTQIWLEASLYTILQILSVSVFEKTPFLQIVIGRDVVISQYNHSNQLNLFD